MLVAATLGVSALLNTSVLAQWAPYPALRTPTTPDGKVDLNAPAPRTPDGKPNLSPKGSLKVWDDETVVFAEIRLNALGPETQSEPCAQDWSWSLL